LAGSRQSYCKNNKACLFGPACKLLVRPRLEYCAAAWSPHFIEDKRLLTIR